MAKKIVKKSVKKAVKKKAARNAVKKAVKKPVNKTAIKRAAKPARPARRAARPASAPIQLPKSKTINTYLTFNGNCEEAFNFYKSVFGGEFRAIQRFKDTPPSANMPMNPVEAERIMHVALPISRETILMGSDTSEAHGPVTVGDNFSISVDTTSQEEAERFFNGLSAGGRITMPLNKTFWGAFFGMLVDKFGIHWLINYDTNS